MSDEKLKAAYSALPREEPGAAVDAAILAASRRALAKPSASRRWAGPVSIAAVLVLAFGVTLRMQEEKLESPEVYVAPPAAPVTQAPAATPPEPKPAQPVAAAPAKKIAPQAKPDRVTALRDEARAQPEQERKDLRPKLQMAPAEESLAKESANVAQAPMAAAPPAPGARAASAPAARMKREAFSAAAPAPAAAAADAQAAIDEPTRELEAIAKLRAEGRHEEADKALEEFRRKRPGYRIPEAMWERVKPR